MVFSVDGNKKKCLPKRCSLSSAEGMELAVERAQKNNVASNRMEKNKMSKAKLPLTGKRKEPAKKGKRSQRREWTK